MRLLLGTSNKGKIMEIKEALTGLPVEVMVPSDFSITEAPHETGDTYEKNAIQKAQFYFDRAHIPTLADDSGIIVHALKNELGIHTRRWGAGAQASDAQWIAYFLDRMKKETDKRATFLCTLAYIDETGAVHTFEGICNGVITDNLEANYLPGLPISACFKPDGFDRVYSALSIEQKNSTSHRGKAVALFGEFLQTHLL